MNKFFCSKEELLSTPCLTVLFRVQSLWLHIFEGFQQLWPPILASYLPVNAVLCLVGMIIVGICCFLDCYEPGETSLREFKPGLQFRSVIAKDRILAVMDWRLWACCANKAAVWLVFSNFHSIVLPAFSLPLKLVAMNVGGPAFWVWIFCHHLFVFV